MMKWSGGLKKRLFLYLHQHWEFRIFTSIWYCHFISYWVSSDFGQCFIGVVNQNILPCSFWFHLLICHSLKTSYEEWWWLPQTCLKILSSWQKPIIIWNSSIQANPNAFVGLCWLYMQIVLKATSGQRCWTNHVFDAFSKPNLCAKWVSFPWRLMVI